jgi:hypothetical protein
MPYLVVDLVNKESRVEERLTDEALDEVECGDAMMFQVHDSGFEQLNPNTGMFEPVERN